MVTITIAAGGTFEPPDVTVAAGDFVVFVNEDAQEHQPAPADSTVTNAWMTDALAPFVDGQPAATSPALTFDGFASGQSIVYADTLDTHPDRYRLGMFVPRGNIQRRWLRPPHSKRSSRCACAARVRRAARTPAFRSVPEDSQKVAGGCSLKTIHRFHRSDTQS